MKNTNFDQLNNDLHDAPWYVGDIFNNIDDQYGYWYALFKSVGKDHAPSRGSVCVLRTCPSLQDFKKAIM